VRCQDRRQARGCRERAEQFAVGVPVVADEVAEDPVGQGLGFGGVAERWQRRRAAVAGDAVGLLRGHGQCPHGLPRGLGYPEPVPEHVAEADGAGAAQSSPTKSICPPLASTSPVTPGSAEEEHQRPNLDSRSDN
jgi:hypothetical protein